MKANMILSYVLSILEGGLSGVCFYHAGKAKETKHKVFWYIASTAWFVLSLLDSMEGSRALKASKAEAAGEPEL